MTKGDSHTVRIAISRKMNFFFSHSNSRERGIIILAVRELSKFTYEFIFLSCKNLNLPGNYFSNNRNSFANSLFLQAGIRGIHLGNFLLTSQERSKSANE